MTATEIGAQFDMALPSISRHLAVLKDGGLAREQKRGQFVLYSIAADHMANLLYGFLTSAERTAFRQLLKISGVGPKVALSVLSGLSVDDLAAAVASEDSGRLTKIPGIGKKTAERLLLELRDKLPKVTAAARADGRAASGEVVSALLTLGYNEREAQAAAKGLPADLQLADAIRQALKALAKT